MVVEADFIGRGVLVFDLIQVDLVADLGLIMVLSKKASKHIA